MPTVPAPPPPLLFDNIQCPANESYDLLQTGLVHFLNACNRYYREQFSDSSFDSKLDAIVALSTLLQGPTELGNSVLAKPGIMDMLLALAESKEIAHQVSQYLIISFLSIIISSFSIIISFSAL